MASAIPPRLPDDGNNVDEDVYGNWVALQRLDSTTSVSSTNRPNENTTALPAAADTSSSLLDTGSPGFPKAAVKSHEAGGSKAARAYKRRQRFSQSWLAELLTWGLGLVFFVALIGILAAFDGASVPRWKFGITLGALASLFASLGGYILMIPVGSAIGQLKWIKFQRMRPLADFESFEKSARGPWGSFLLLVKRKGGIIAAVGALLTILQLAIGPFVQQIIDYESRPVNITDAMIPIEFSYILAPDNDNPVGLDIPLAMKAAIMNGILSPGTPSSDFEINPSCSTGNCTWPKYQTLSMCSRCVDLTSRLNATIFTPKPPSVNPSVYSWTLPNGLSISAGGVGPSALVNMTINNTLQNALPIGIAPAGPYYGSVAFSTDEQHDFLLDFFVLIAATAYNEDTIVGPFAWECILEACVRTLSASSTNNEFSETEQGDPTVIPLSGGGSSGNFTLISSTYGQATILAFQTFLSQTFTGRTNQFDGSLQLFPNGFSQAMFLAVNSTPPEIENLMDNIAKSMSRNMRTRVDTGPKVTGKATAEQSFVHIEWVWISLPLGLLVADLAFILLIIFQTRRHRIPKWTDDVLPTLIYGLDNETRQELRSASERGDVGDASKRMHVRVTKDEDGWSLKQS